MGVSDSSYTISSKRPTSAGVATVAGHAVTRHAAVVITTGATVLTGTRVTWSCHS